MTPPAPKLRCRWSIVLAGAICLALSLDVAAKEPKAPTTAPGEIHLTILHINDVHGQTQERTVGGKSVGGYARLATVVGQARARNPNTLVLHAGDELSRGDGLTRSTLGAANFDLMNAIGVAAFTPGNGDYYDGVDVLRQRASQAKFPLLAANVYLREGHKPLVQRCAILDVGKVKVAVFGLCFLRVQHPSAWALQVDDPIETARELVPELRKQADVVVALSHLGVDVDQQLAAKVDGIDLIVGGHTHTRLPRGIAAKSPGGQAVLIVQAGDLLNYVGSVDLRLEAADKGYRLTDAKATLIDLDAKVRQDPQIKAQIARLAAATQPATKQAAPGEPVPVVR